MSLIKEQHEMFLCQFAITEHELGGTKIAVGNTWNIINHTSQNTDPQARQRAMENMQKAYNLIHQATAHCETAKKEILSQNIIP